jgi:hypothetical protein
MIVTKITSNEVRQEACFTSVGCYDGEAGKGTGKWMVSFAYADGTVQEFDGTKWHQAEPEKKPSAKLFDGMGMLPR